MGFVHIHSPETDNCPSWISRGDQSPQKNVAGPSGDQIHDLLITSQRHYRLSLWTWITVWAVVSRPSSKYSCTQLDGGRLQCSNVLAFSSGKVVQYIKKSFSYNLYIKYHMYNNIMYLKTKKKKTFVTKVKIHAHKTEWMLQPDLSQAKFVYQNSYQPLADWSGSSLDTMECTDKQ